MHFRWLVLIFFEFKSLDLYDLIVALWGLTIFIWSFDILRCCEWAVFLWRVRFVASVKDRSHWSHLYLLSSVSLFLLMLEVSSSHFLFESYLDCSILTFLFLDALGIVITKFNNANTFWGVILSEEEFFWLWSLDLGFNNSRSRNSTEVTM